MLCYNFNSETGNFITAEEMQCDPLVPGRYLQPANSTLVAPPEFNPGVSSCRWNGTAWIVEVIVEPEEPEEPQPTEKELKQREIAGLKSQLAAGDYRIIKIAEYAAAGKPAPYDIVELNAARDAIRNEINQLETELAAMIELEQDGAGADANQ